MRTKSIPTLALALLLLALMSPLASAIQDDVLPPEVEYEPPIRMTSLFAYSQDTLSAELVEQAETSIHNFQLGFGSFSSSGPTF